MGPEFNEQNPNLQDLPPSQPEGGPVSRDVGSDLQQVMSAQAATERAPLMNGTYGSMGSMNLDSEVRAPPAEVFQSGVTEVGTTTRARCCQSPRGASDSQGWCSSDLSSSGGVSVGGHGRNSGDRVCNGGFKGLGRAEAGRRGGRS